MPYRHKFPNSQSINCTKFNGNHFQIMEVTCITYASYKLKFKTLNLDCQGNGLINNYMPPLLYNLLTFSITFTKSFISVHECNVRSIHTKFVTSPKTVILLISRFQVDSYLATVQNHTRLKSHSAKLANIAVLDVMLAPRYKCSPL